MKKYYQVELTSADLLLEANHCHISLCSTLGFTHSSASQSSHFWWCLQTSGTMGRCCRGLGPALRAVCCNALYHRASFFGSLLRNRLLRPGTDTTRDVERAKSSWKGTYRNPQTPRVRIYTQRHIYMHTYTYICIFGPPLSDGEGVFATDSPQLSTAAFVENQGGREVLCYIQQLTGCSVSDPEQWEPHFSFPHCWILFGFPLWL